ncbi:MAG TPA: PDZ domain-containing protein [Saprospiraceae bacterium]|nr:PDZ domain-containing protein [Saprospiraceae bacterium]
MKRLHTLGLTLFLLCVCTLATVQPASAQDNKKVVVIKKTTDASGQQTVEKVIVTDDENDALLQEINAEVVDKVVVINGNCNKDIANHANKMCIKEDGRQVVVNVTNNDDEKVISINVDGETETIHLAKGEELSEVDKARLAKKGIFLNPENGVTWVGKDHDLLFSLDKCEVVRNNHAINSDDYDFDFDINLEGLSDGLVSLGKGLAHLGDFNYAFAYDAGDINCAALGVYVSTSQSGGVYVNSTIGSSGAEEAGLQTGDIIRSIDEFPMSNYGQLHDVLAKYQPGDVVTVMYNRSGVEDRVETQLRAWKDFPSFASSRHALVTCDKQVPAEEFVTRKIIVIKKDKVDEPILPENVNQSPIVETFDNSLILSDFVAFPNPTEGKFNVQFTAEAQPTVVSVFDASGKEIFRDNVDNFNGYYNREIDLTSHARGALVLSVEQDGKSFTEQIVLH